MTIIILLAIFTFANAQLQPDKVKHLAAGAIISQTSFVTGQLIWKDAGTSMRLSMYTVIMVAWGKEGYDAFSGGNFSFADFGSTIVSGLTTSLINRWIFRPKKHKSKTDPYDWSKDPLVKN